MNDSKNRPGTLSKFLHLVPYSAGVLFVLGVLVENVFLNQYGITDISLFRIQYIIVGAEFAVFLTFPFVIFILPFHMIFIEYKHLFTPSSLKTILVQFCICLLSWVILILPYYFFFRFLVTGWAGYSLSSFDLPPLYLVVEILSAMVFHAIIVYVLIFLPPVIFPRAFASKFLSLFIRAGTGVFLVSFFIAGVSFYPRLIHPYVARSFAGGKPVFADVRVSEEFARLGQEFSKDLSSSCLMQRQVVIYSDLNNIYLLSTIEGFRKTVVIPKKYVEYLVIPRESGPSSNQTKTQKSEKPVSKEKLVPYP
jgi:hypothetical protein